MNASGKKLDKISFVLSMMWLLLLIYNIFAAKLISAAVNLFVFILISPVFFRSFKERHSRFFKTLSYVFIIPLLITLVFSIGLFQTGMDDTIPAEEQNYIDTVLSQITAETTKNDAIALLGQPDRDLVSKVNWWVNIAGQNSRVGIYFSSSGTANEVVLDGGTGRFYYRKSLE